MTTISRDIIQFEGIGPEDGNGQMYRDEAASIWASAATRYLIDHEGVGAEVTVRNGNDHTRFFAFGYCDLVDAADAAGWAAVEEYAKTLDAEDEDGDD